MVFIASQKKVGQSQFIHEAVCCRRKICLVSVFCVFGVHTFLCFLVTQAIIGNYAVPILEDRQVWGTSDQTQTAYLDSQVGSPCDTFTEIPR